MAKLKILSVCSIKGGVGKTVSSVNIAGEMARYGNCDVILIDLDPQGNSSQYLGYTPNIIEKGTVDLFEGAKLKEVICKTQFNNLYIVPTEISLMNVEWSLSTDRIENKKNVNLILRDKLKEYENEDMERDTFIVLDTRPDFGVFTMNALLCAERVVCPVTPCLFALHGFNMLLSNIDVAREKYNNKIRLLGLYKNNWAKSNTVVVKKVEEELKEYSKFLMETEVPGSVDVENSKFECSPLTFSKKYNNKPVEKAYRNLIKEITNNWERVIR